MKKSRFFLALLFVSLALVLIPTTAKAALWEVPTGLNPGDTFRWVFVTSTTTDAISSDIDYYNTFVNKAADAADTTIAGVVGFTRITQIDWRVIGSTSSVDAIDNIGVSGADIYTTLGELVANGTTDMFDEDDLYNPIKFTEKGDELPAWVWTGTSPWGVALEPLGDDDCTT